MEQKAKELVEKFMKWSKYENHVRNKRVAKQCALICVDEILKENKRINEQSGYPTPLTEWWQQVKQEIRKL